jgi:hypothetical protein
MSLAAKTTGRAKFDELLQLTHEQIEALERGDKKAFDLILAAKRALIDSFTDARSLIEADPALQDIVIQIQECDQAAQRLLYRKIGWVMRELCELQQAQRARRAYHKADMATPRRTYPFQPDTPRFIDRKS